MVDNAMTRSGNVMKQQVIIKKGNLLTWCFRSGNRLAQTGKE
jgi:hypothetical protein